MVAISLYKGNLHKATDVPQQWPMPTRKLTLRDFRNLRRRRLNALSVLQSTSNPNPGADPSDDGNNNVEDIEKRDPGVEGDVDPMDLDEDQILKGKDLKEVRDDEKVLESEESLGKSIKESDALIEGKNGKDIGNENKAIVVVNPEPEQVPNKDIDIVAKEKRINEVQEKLKVLNEKKHSLVLVLKQILSAEEELKRRSSLQGMAGRQLPSLQVDNTNDSGSMTRLNTPRTISDGNLGGDMDVGEADDACNHNVRPGNLLRLSSTSPSSDSQLKKPASNAVPLASRTALGAVGSPSRFVPTGQQGTTSNPPSVSVSGTNYIGSSPSPAASGGTSVLRDGRLPSPWN